MADGIRRPRHGHDAHCAVELRDVEVDRRLAVGIQFHRTGEESDEPFGRRAAARSHGIAVATGAQASGGAERAIDQPAVEVAQFKTEPALAEIPGFRIGCLVVGEVEDADIDRSNGHIGVRSGGQAGHRDGNRQRLARLRLFDRRKRDRQLLAAGVYCEPFETDGARRHARLLAFAGPEEGGRHIGAGTPVRGDGNVDRRAAFRHAGREGRQQPVGADRNKKLAGEARRNLQLGDFARGVAVLVEGDLQPVRRVGRGRRHIPAGIEFNAGGRPFRIGGFDFEAIASPVDRHGKACRSVGGNVERAVRYGLR